VTGNEETMSESDPSASEVLARQRILDMASAFQTSRLLLTACELGMFDALDSGPMSSAEVAQVIRAEPRATDRLMNALCAVGLLEKTRGQFTNTPSAARWLVQGKRESLVNLFHMAHLWDTWSTLTDAVRAGGSPMVRPPKARDAAWLRAFIDAMHWRASQHAPHVIAALDLSGVSRVLDVGGGSGAYAMAFAQAKNDLQAVVFDLPGVVPLAQEYIARGDLSDRVRVVAGDYDVDALGNGFDIVFLSAILHGNNPERNRALLRKSASALVAGGRVIVQDFIMEDDRTAPAFGALFALNMLVGTDGGDTYTEFEVRQWMEATGLTDVVRQDTAFGTSLITGRKAPALAGDGPDAP
jgi:3-hydroxy-5-methyl-1-naphthoate 3-O-methyltransferase